MISQIQLDAMRQRKGELEAALESPELAESWRKLYRQELADLVLLIEHYAAGGCE